MHSLSAAFLAAVHFSTMPQKPALLIRISHHFADAAASNTGNRPGQSHPSVRQYRFAITGHVHT
jgi:hypothetical protein